MKMEEEEIMPFVNEPTEIKYLDTDLNKGHDGQPHLKGEIRQRSNLTSAIVSLSAIQMGLGEIKKDGSRSDDKPRKKERLYVVIINAQESQINHHV